MKQKAVIITITITIIMVMMMAMTTMIVMLMVPVTWMLTGLVMDGEVDACPSLPLRAVTVPKLDVRSGGHRIFLTIPLILWYCLCVVVVQLKELEIV
jgi:hypothetical protein